LYHSVEESAMEEGLDPLPGLISVLLDHGLVVYTA
jgi:hypothetical protein